MAEVGIIDGDREAKEFAEEQLRKLVSDYSFREARKKVYRGHPAMYLSNASKTMLKVQKSGGMPMDELLRKKPHWHKDFKVIIADGNDSQEQLNTHNELFAREVIYDAVRHTREGRPFLYVTPVGPMGHYPIIADIFNGDFDKHPELVDELRGMLGGEIEIEPRLVHTHAMDEWADENGNLVSRANFLYIGNFRDDMHEQFYGLLKGKAKIPEKNKNYAANKGLRDYQRKMEDLLAKDAGVLFTGGVGMIGHIMFWEPTFGRLFGKELSEKVTYIRGAPLTTETLAQNRFTSARSAPVPAYANTIGLGLFCMLRGYGEKNPEKARAVFGLDNVEEPLIWQRFIAQSMLSIQTTDPSFAASYPATMPGAYIVVANHLKDFSGKAK